MAKTAALLNTQMHSMNVGPGHAITLLMLGTLSAGSFATADVAGQAPEASSAALLRQTDLHYAGSFKLPRIDSLQYPNDSIAVHDGLLMVQGRPEGTSAAHFDFSIPDPATVPYAELPTATLAKTYPTLDEENVRYKGNPKDTAIRGLLFVDRKLIMSIASYYDASAAQTTSHLSRDLDTGMVTAYALRPVGHTAGYMTLAPDPIGPALTGNFGLPIVTRESWGPAAWSFDPLNMAKQPVPLLDYDSAHPLGPWNRQSEVWNSDSKLGGLALIGRSLVFIGVHGLGPFCYGPGENSRYDTSACNDVVHQTADHGTHTDPYTVRMWVYDINDLIAVKRGRKKPWDPKPYGLWNIDLPYASGRTQVAGTYDAATKRLFISQQFSDKDPAEGFPVIHVFRID